jgi:hypothetical protein
VLLSPFLPKKRQLDIMMHAETATVVTHRPHKEDWVDRTVRLAQSCNKLFTRNTCRVCQVYVDKQVEFEKRQEDTSSPISRVWLKTAAMEPTLEVELYRQFLFDEESVVETVCDRDKENYTPTEMSSLDHKDP